MVKSDGSTYTFEYNEDGLRTKLTTPTTTAEYIWHGDRIVHMTRGSYEFHFYYDAQGRPSEIIYKGNPYSYQYNLQGAEMSARSAG